MEYVEGADLARIGSVLSQSHDLTTAVSSAWERLREEKKGLFDHVPEAHRPRPPPSKSAGGEVRQLAMAFRDAALGLHHLHEAGIVHRDVKPGNLMLTAADRRVVVMDLGLAAITGASRSITKDRHQILGTLRYMAPEQLQRNLLTVDRRADVYSLGATFYELLVGRPLLDGDTEPRLIEQILKSTPTPARRANPRLPLDLSTILAKATEKDAALRYPGADDLARDLDAFLDGRPIAARPPSLGYVLRLAVRRNKAVSATVAGALLALVAVVVYFLGSLASERDQTQQALSDVLRLADSKKVRDLAREVDDLWPLRPERAGAMSDWLARVRPVLANRPEHEVHLAALRATGDGADPKADWQRQVLTDLLADMDRLHAAVSDVERRLAFSSTLRRVSLEEPAAEWDRAIEEVAASDRYGGLRIGLQLGLVPLGADPDSGLQEFAHVGSGSRPQRDAQGRLVLDDDTAVVLVLLPGGTFAMGSQKTDPEGPNFDPQAAEDEGPVHEVRISPLFLAKHECTQAQWKALADGATPSQFQGAEWGGRRVGPRNPVEQVSWDAATTWLARHGLTLPSEAQWEYACRAGTDTPWWVDSHVESLSRVANVADAYSSAHGGTQPWMSTIEIRDGHSVHAPVGSFLPNAFGLHDVHGNVWEWCADVYAGDYYATGRPADGAWVDPPGPPKPATSHLRVFRGGGWNNAAVTARSAYRSGTVPEFSHDPGVGLRPARALAP
jgi:formylglycine-generating enzyme required for sulfatase activity